MTTVRNGSKKGDLEPEDEGAKSFAHTITHTEAGDFHADLTKEQHGWRKDMRIALCGYEGEHSLPKEWTEHAWKAKGGYASQGDGSNENARRERIWFSPHCLPLVQRQASLFSENP